MLNPLTFLKSGFGAIIRGQIIEVVALTKDGELLVGLQSLLSGEGEVEPARPRQVYLHGATKHFHIGRSPLDGLSANLHSHARHHHGAVVVDCFHSESPRLRGNKQNKYKLKLFCCSFFCGENRFMCPISV